MSRYHRIKVSDMDISLS